VLEKIHSQRPLQLLLGLAIGFCFGFLLQKGGVTRYDVIMGQLLLRDWTVVKVILSAILTGMIGIHLLRIPGLARLHTWSGSFGSTVIGGLIFGIGFAVLGYCPGTLAGAAGQGSLDALIGGVPGMLVGAGIYAAIYPKLAGSVLKLGEFDQETIPQVLGVKPWPVIAVVTLLILAIFAVIEVTGSLS
jgi:hypothetical protein